MKNAFNISQTNRIGLYLVLTLVASTLLVSCQDSLLTKQPLGEQTSGTFFQTQEDAILATNASYEHLRNFGVHVFAYMGMTTIASDDAEKGSTPADASFLRELDEFTFNPGNNAFSGTWGAYYQGIQRTNQAIVNIPNIQDMDEDLRARLIGENKFIRAYLYFFLARSYGGVPLITEPFTSDEFDVERSTLEETYNLIEQDLNDAIAALPRKSEYSADNLGRATEGAAKGLLAKVHLFQEEYAEAEQLAVEVINSNEYSLAPDYGEMFRVSGENGVESIFEVQATSTETNLGGNSRYNQVQGVRGVPNLGWGFNGPSVDLNNAYEPGDPRQEETILYVWEETPEPLADGNKGVVRDNPSMIDERYNQKAFISDNLPGDLGSAGGNIRRLRLADVMLIAAEAAYHNGNETDARDYVNQIRERARNGRTATIGISVEPLNFVLADTTGESDELEKPFIRYVDDQGTASAEGFLPLETELVSSNSLMVVNNLDIIQSLDGTPITSVEDYYNIMSAKNPGDPIVMEVLRVEQTYDMGSGTRNTTTSTVIATFNTQELLPDITASGQALLDAIWQERRVELAMEHHRFFDLRRQGRAQEVLQAVGKNYESPKHDLYPIPQGEIDNTGGLLQQNPGYN